MPIEAKFDVDPPWDGGTKVCSNGTGHMTAMPKYGKNMTAMPIYDKNMKKSSSRTKRPMTLKVDMQHQVLA